MVQGSESQRLDPHPHSLSPKGRGEMIKLRRGISLANCEKAKPS